MAKTSDLRKDEWIHVRLTPADHAEVVTHAQRRGLTLSDHIRDIMLKAARGQIKIDEPVQGTLLF
jgi:hypothetical protein